MLAVPAQMAGQPKSGRPHYEVADIFREYGGLPLRSISVKLSNFAYVEMISEVIFNPFQRSFT